MKQSGQCEDGLLAHDSREAPRRVHDPNVLEPDAIAVLGEHLVSWAGSGDVAVVDLKYVVDPFRRHNGRL